jgi:malate synthase
MRAAIGLAVAAAIFAGVAVTATRMATVERHLADTREALATLDYPQAAGSVDAATESLGLARYVPGFGDRVQREARAYNAAILYWERKYDALVPEGADPVSTIEEGNTDLQLVVANAAYRKNQKRYADVAATKQALQESASNYLTVLKSGTWHQDAAYNYEYVVRLRDEQARGKRPPEGNDEAQKADNGQGGSPSEATSQQGFEIYIPLESTEKPSGGDAGKAPPKERKG